MEILPLKDLPKHYALYVGIGFLQLTCPKCNKRGSLVTDKIGKYKVPKNVDRTK